MQLEQVKRKEQVSVLVCVNDVSPLDAGDGETVDVCDTTDATSSASSVWQGFKIIGDNVDKNVKPSFMRINTSTPSLHYFHSYAVLDRVDLSGIPDIQPPGTCDLLALLPSSGDVDMLKQHFSVLISR